MAVRVDTHHPRLGVGRPEVIVDFAGDEPEGFDVSPDGRRFLVVKRPPTYRVQLDVVLHWIQEVRQKLQ